MALRTIETGENFKILQEGDDGPKLLLLRNVRLSFPALAYMKEDESDDGVKTKSFKASPMLPKKTHKAARQALMDLGNELCVQNKGKVLAGNWCIKDGDETEREEYQGHWIISAKDAKVRPVIRDKAGDKILDEKKLQDDYEDGDERKDAKEEILQRIEEMFPGGVIVDILIRPWYFTGKTKSSTKTFPKRICAGLSAVKFVRDDGVRFSKGTIDDSSAWDDDDEPKPAKKSVKKAVVDDDDDEL